MTDSLSSTILGALVEIGASYEPHLSPLGPLVGGLASFSLTSFLKRRADAAVEILIDELKKGELPVSYVVPPDHSAAVLLRIQRAAVEGTARLNLRLMAQVVRGKIVQKDLVASEFLYYANILSDLKRPEIALLGTVLSCEMANPDIKEDQDKTANAVKKTLAGRPYFPDEQSVEMYCEAVARHGLLVEPPGDKRMAWGSFPILPSRILRDLAALVDIDSALAMEIESHSG